MKVFRFKESNRGKSAPTVSADRERATMASSALFQALPSDFQEQVFLNIHLWNYIEGLDIQEIGIPEFVPRLSRNLRGEGSNNLIYPVGSKVFIHLYTAEGEARDRYIAVEPATTVLSSGLMDEVDERLIDYVGELQDVVGGEKEEREKVLIDILDRICDTGNGKKKRASIKVTPDELDQLRYIMLRDKEGMGAIQPLVSDPYIEDVSCSGVGSVFVEHKIFGGLTSGISFDSTEDLDKFVIKLSENWSPCDCKKSNRRLHPS